MNSDAFVIVTLNLKNTVFSLKIFLSAFFQHRPVVKHEATYRMEPKQKFAAERAEAIIRKVLNNHLEGANYDPNTVQPQISRLCDVVKAELKALHCDRYRFVVTAVIGESGTGCDIQIASRCIWDNDRDTFATYTFENASIFACASVFAILAE